MSGNGVGAYKLRLARVLPGAVKFNEQNVNDTFRGQILTDESSVESTIIKDLTPKELSNELIAAAFATLLGLPIPLAYLAVVPPGVLNVQKGPTTQDGQQLVFASVAANAQSLRFRLQSSLSAAQLQLLSDLTEWSQLGDLYAFDAWVANVDRNVGNLLYAGKDKVWIIDHGHCFSGPNWAPAHLDPKKTYRHRLKEWLTSRIPTAKRADVAQAASSFCKQIGKMSVSATISSSGAIPISVASDIQSLDDFLNNRVPELPGHTADALGLLVL
jgi:hypothetical protein